MTERGNEFGLVGGANARSVSALGAVFCALATILGCTPEDTAAPPTVEPVEPRASSRVQVLVVGSGTPVADPERGGPATAIVIDGETLLFDAGPGVFRGLAAAGRRPADVEHVFLTHLHSDHTLGLDAMIFGAWTVGRDRPLRVHGPAGVEGMVQHLEAAFAEDRAMRVDGLEAASPTGAGAVTSVVHEGVVLREGDVTVRAFGVEHGTFAHAFGYRVEGPGRRVVISGDTAPSEAVVRACDGCDVLVHEVYSTAGWREGPDGFRAYHAAFHTSGEQLGRLAARARPRLLVLTHLLFFGRPPHELLEEVRAGFDGEVVIAEDGGEY